VTLFHRTGRNRPVRLPPQWPRREGFEHGFSAAQIAVDTVRAHQGDSLKLVRFVCFDEGTRDIYARLLGDGQASR